jgi:3-oxoacyl-[acyl-carrier-protein] synthase II
MITGFGIACPLGHTVDEFGEALYAGRSCIGPIHGWDVGDHRYTYGGQFHDFDLSREMPQVRPRDVKHLLRFSQLALVAADRALHDAGVQLSDENLDRIGSSFGTVIGGLGETVEEQARRYFQRGEQGISRWLWSEFTPCATTTHVAIYYGLRGPSTTYSSGCVSGMDTIVWGAEQIRAGKADMMLVGGSDAPFFPSIWAAIYRSGILAPTPIDGGNIPRPFSVDHDGIVLMEGGSAVMLESETHARLRGARIYGELVGAGNVEEALPMSALDETGEAFAMTMQRTLFDAGIPPTDVDWVIAHGTGFAVADVSESRGIETALGKHAFSIPVTSIRGAVGQSFACSGGLNLAAACLAIRHQRVPPTINFTAPAEGCRLDYVPNVARTARVRRVLINVAGVGGTHSGILVARYEEA